MNNIEYGNSKKEQTNQSTLKIEHVGNLDIIVNPGYKDKTAVSILRDTLQHNSIVQISKDEVFETHFFIKAKSPESIKYLNNFAKDKNDIEPHPIDPLFQNDFNKKAINNKASILNETIISEKVKKVVESEEVQSIAKETGYFYGMYFCEPIISIVDRQNGNKYKIYEKIHADPASPIGTPILSDTQLKKLRAIFFRNNIFPHDLRQEQFMITRKEGKPYLVLIDTEAYREMKK